MTTIPLLTRARVILSLCDYTGEWSRPYAEAGYDVRQIDLGHGQDVRLLAWPGIVHGILAAPPCTQFAGSGARWWEAKGEGAIVEGLSVVDACLRLVAVCRPRWWALENPVGRLDRWIGPPTFTFQPCWYGDPYTKKTHLWGQFNTNLPRRPVEPTEGSKMHKLPPSPNRQRLRSVTPAGFAQAFMEANP